jgi:hypothetical protein
MTSDRHNWLLKFQAMTAGLVLVLLAASSAGFAQNNLTKSDCGGEGDPVCKPGDGAYSTNNDFPYSPSHNMSCDYGLGAKDGFCTVNAGRHHFPALNTSMVGKQILAQEYSIGADTPINWLNILGTHNSFSNVYEGALSKIVTDQWWSLSDQLDLGARSLMLDVHYYDNQMRLCHLSTGDDGFGCPQFQDGRLYLFGIKEIAYWLKKHPGEVVILRINNTVDGQYDYLLDGPIKEYLGSMAFTPNEFDGGKWPTLRELRAQGKQIIILSDNWTQWIHSWSRYVLYDAEPNDSGLDQCHNHNGVDVRSRNFNQFAYVAEDRSASGSGGELDAYLFPLLDNCGFSFIDVDFLSALSHAFIQPASDDSEPRLQASVWSLAPQTDPTVESPMVMTNLKMQPGQKSDLHPFACAGPGIGPDQGTFPPVRYPGSHFWTFTKAADIWKNGEITCQNEFGPTYHFWAPGSGIEYGELEAQAAISLETAPFWVNYFGGPVLTGTPNVISLKWNKTQAVPANAPQIILRGGQGGALAAVPDDAPQTEFFTSSEVSMVNAHTVSVGLNAQLASKLPIGFYTQTLRIDETDPATGQVNSTRFPVTLQVSDTLLLSSSLVTLGNCAGSPSAKVFVKSGGKFTLDPSDSWLHVTTDSSTAPATLVITADPTGLLSGLHSGYVKVVAPQTTNGGAVIQVNFTVNAQTTISSAPASPGLSYFVDGTKTTGTRPFCWASGTAHVVSAPITETLAAGSRAQFLAWSDGGSPTHTFLQPGAADDLVANFNLQYQVTASVNNTGFGMVVLSPASSSGYYNLGTTITFTAKPKAGHSFSDFVINGTLSSTNPLVLQLTAPLNVVAEFH